MNFWWKDSDWKLKPKGFDVSRRAFLGGTAALLAAPMIAHAGVLMPVKQLFVPNVVTRFQHSYDGENWFDHVRVYGRAAGGHDGIHMTAAPKFTRTIIETEWRPQQLTAYQISAAERRYASPVKLGKVTRVYQSPDTIKDRIILV